MRRFCQALSLVLSLLVTLEAWSQSSSTSSAAAGLAAGAALGASTAQSPTSASSAGASSAPIEMNIMVYGGLKKIALTISEQVASTIRIIDDSCSPSPVRGVLLEDSISAAQTSIYATWNAYQQSLKNTLSKLADATQADVDEIQKIQRDETRAKEEAARKKEEQARKQAPPANKLEERQKYLQENVEVENEVASTVTTPTTTGGNTAPPVSLSYLSDIIAAVGAAKSGITYTPSSIQATTQALTTELGRYLSERGVFLYTSTSSINVDDAAKTTIDAMNSIVTTNGTIQSYVYLNPPDTTDADKPKVQRLISDIAAKAAVANQLVTTFQSWLSSNDGNGNLILTDVIRGLTLQDALKCGIPALQFTIDAAGGNTRTNSFFLLNLFYTPKPSFNGGVVVTYELRNKENRFIAGDTLKVLYDYTKWKPKGFSMNSEEADDTSLGTGRATRSARQVGN
jgi:Skp family chaperone for outer membrane proteins